mmetsp:Transcript_33898/g.65970  ORF Transcript_33898/g.65970 Transcript_33898/m.65970 type:complete len:510 (+) Transcript_33898:25-1554(+)
MAPVPLGLHRRGTMAPHALMLLLFLPPHYTAHVISRSPLCQRLGSRYGSIMTGGGRAMRRRLRASTSTTALEKPKVIHTSTTEQPAHSQWGHLFEFAEEKDGIQYLDHAQTYKKPKRVLDAIDQYYDSDNANVHRGAHTLAARATEGYEGARAKIASLINAYDTTEVVYTRGATEAINLVANTWGNQNIKEGDEIIISVMEHHSNIIPWQRLAARTGGVLKFVDLTEQAREVDGGDAEKEGEGDDHRHVYNLQQLQSLITDRTKLVAVCHASNVLGVVNPIKEIVDIAHKHHAKVLLDASQTMARVPIDVQQMGVDFLVASGHKMMAPSGIGFLWGKYEVLESMEPWQGGGEMIDEVFLETSTYAPPPGRFEAGTPAIAETIGIGAAVDLLTEADVNTVHDNERLLGNALYDGLKTIPGVQILGGRSNRLGMASFACPDVNAEELKALLKEEGYRVASGFHDAQPIHERLGLNDGSIRVSFSVAHGTEDVTRFVDTLSKILEGQRARVR